MNNKQLDTAERIARILAVLSQFTPNNYDDSLENKPIFSRKFVLKDLLGFEYEEIARNDNWIDEEIEQLKNIKRKGNKR